MPGLDPTGRVSHPDEFHRGVSWKRPVRVATSSNINLVSPGATIDGVTMASLDRFLATAETAASSNGIYIWNGPTTAATRAFDMDQDGTTTSPAEEIAGAFVYVIEGSVNSGKLYYTTNVNGGTLGSTSINFSQFTSGGGSLTIKDEGTPLATSATSIDFVGPLVTASGATAAKTVTVTGALDDLTDVVISAPASADRLRYSGTEWDNSNYLWKNVMVLDPTSGNWLPVTTGGGDAVYTEAP